MATELKHTVKPSGGDFTTLSAALAHLGTTHSNLVTADVYATIEIDGTWSSADTTAISMPNITGDATRYLSIYTTATARHDGKWDTGAYILSTSNATAILFQNSVNITHIRIDGLQIGLSSANANYQCCIDFAAAGAGTTIWVSNCILKQANNNSYRTPAILSQSGNVTLNAWNTVAYGVGTNDNALNSVFCGYDFGAFNLYSCVAIGGKYAYYANDSGGTMTVKNSYGGGTVTEDFYRGAGTLAKTNCASEDSSADDTGTGETASNCDVTVALDTDTFVAVASGSEDYHLAADGNSPLVGQGTDTSGESSPFNFTTDIDGDTRDSTWDIGADAWVVAASTANNTLCMIV